MYEQNSGCVRGIGNRIKKIRRNKAIAALLAAALFAVVIPLLPPSICAADSYGDAAKAHLQYIDANFPERWSQTENNARMREWLVQTVTSFGYSPELLYAEGTSPYGWGDYTGYNIEFKKYGTTAQEVVVCAHYDSASTNGCEDNGTGVSVLLELAQRFAQVETKYTIRFLLFDIEEPGCLGSAYYVNHSDISNVICAINIDSVGAGDDLYVYGGDYVGDTLVRSWALEQILATASYTGIPLLTVPEDYEGTNVRPPAKTSGSDHAPFNDMEIPYIYLASSYWDSTEASGLQQTADPSIPDGKIMHVAEYDNLAFLTAHFGDRVYTHMAQCSEVMTYMLLYMDMELDASELYVTETETEASPSPTSTLTPTPTPIPEQETETDSAAAPAETQTPETNGISETDSAENGVTAGAETVSNESGAETEADTADTKKGGGNAQTAAAVGCIAFAGLLCGGLWLRNRLTERK